MAVAVRLIIFLLAGLLSLRGESLELEVKLLKITPAPTTAQVRPYPRALATYQYEVKKVHRGAYRDDKIVVVKWALWERVPLEGLPTQVGIVERLQVDRFIDHPGLKGSRIVDGIGDRERVLYYDSSSRPSPKVVAELKGKGDEMKTGVVVGAERGWLFLADELEHATTGRFWEQPWKDVSRTGTNPLPVMLDSQKRLKEIGVQLLIVPVPTKVSIYPEKLAKELETSEAPSDYLQLLSLAGLNVLDLHAVFRKHREEPRNRPLYCAQDSHWTPDACRLAARAIYQRIEKKEPKPIGQLGNAIGRQRLIVGDLAQMRRDLSLPKELLVLDEVLYTRAGDVGGHGYDHPRSEVILLGDSNIAVFSDPVGELHGRGGGLPDYLSSHYSGNKRVDVIPALGDGVHQARRNLYRWRSINPDHRDYYWKNKRWVVWCFSMREFTRASNWSAKVPLVKKKARN